MERGGFERLIQSLAPAESPIVAEAVSPPPERTPAPGQRTAAPPLPMTPASPAAAVAEPAIAEEPTTGGSAAIGPAAVAAAVAPSPPGPSGQAPPIDLNPAHLKISAAEQELMKKLFPFVPSPRAAKRMVNVYRLLRATVGRDDWRRFLGAGGDGDFRAVLLLLALLTGYPSEGTDILRDLVEAPPGGASCWRSWTRSAASASSMRTNRARSSRRGPAGSRATRSSPAGSRWRAARRSPRTAPARKACTRPSSPVERHETCVARWGALVSSPKALSSTSAWRRGCG
jgi:hypothetical protein